MSLSMVTYGCSHTFTGFVIAEILGAIGATFCSGAFQAWFVDSMKHHGYTGEFSHLFARQNLLQQIGGGLGAIAGSYSATIHPSLPWFIGATSLIVTGIIASIVMDEPYFVRSSVPWNKRVLLMHDIARSSIHYGIHHTAVRFILGIMCIYIFAIQALNMYWQPFFRSHGVHEEHLGYIYFGIMLAIAGGAGIASRIRAVGRERLYITLSLICSGALIIASTCMNNTPMVIVLFLIHEIPRGCIGPFKDNYLHTRIPSTERATITSFCATAPHIGGAIGLLVSGLIAQTCSIYTSWVVAGISLIIGTLIVSSISSRRSS